MDVCLVILKVSYIFFWCTVIMPPVYTFANWQWISMGETYFTKLNHLTVFAGQSFQCYCHYISTYTMNIWLTLAPSGVCYPYHTCYLLPKKNYTWVTQRLLSREPYFFNMLGIFYLRGTWLCVTSQRSVLCVQKALQSVGSISVLNILLLSYVQHAFFTTLDFISHDGTVNMYCCCPHFTHTWRIL